MHQLTHISTALRGARAMMKKAVPLALMAGAALLAMPAAHADVITFDGIGNGAMGRDGHLLQAGFSVSPVEKVAPENGALVAFVVNGAAPNCYQYYCPGASSNYLTAVNGSDVDVARQNAQLFGLASFDAVFGSATKLLVTGTLANSSVVTQEFYSVGGSAFEHFSTSGAFATGQFTSLSFSALTCDSGVCSSATQFGLDNITTAVPEASTYLMMALGLLFVAGATRRQRSK